jgi:tRNA G18 (ribose-2'-O)-methylase SpoU
MLPEAIDIESLDDERVAGYRDLKDREARRRHGLFVVEGRLNLECLIESSPFETLSVFVDHAAWDAMRGYVAKLDDEVPVYRATTGLMSGVVGFDIHRGCLALGRRPQHVGLTDVLAGCGDRDAGSLIVGMEGLSDLDNVGVVFRNAMAFGAQAIVACPRCCDPLYRKAIRTSMGATLCVPFTRAESWPDAPLGELRAAGYTLVALDPDGESLRPRAPSEGGLATPERIALIVGTEGRGIAPETLALSDHRVRIDMASGVDSVNVGTAAGIALHHYFLRGIGQGTES